VLQAGEERQTVKERIRNLIETYKGYLKRERSKRARYILENVIEDLQNALTEAQ
jgi:hypothetical protein